MTSKQRSQLKSIAMTQDAILNIGKESLTEEFVSAADEALEARELIKLRILETCPVDVKTAANEIAQGVGADVVQVIGSRFILYRESKDNKTIKLVK